MAAQSPAALPAAARPAAARPGLSGQAAMAVRAFRFWLTNYRRTWRGSIYTSIANPVLYLGAMGLGLGSLVDARGTASLGGVSYLAFLAPGLLASTAMQTALGESTYPVMSSVKWLKTYQAAAATPLAPRDLFRGHLLFTAMRLAMTAALFLAVMAAFGAVASPWAIAAIPVCVLTGLAFATPIEAFAVTREKDGSFALLYRFGLIPLFLFSGTFFPVTQLPAAIRPLAYATPLWNGVALCRSLALGHPDLPGTVGHVAYLAALAVIGLLIGQRTYRRRLYV
ncbi:MAG TPA: ABC transporter permease [Streptosporangiaceae bacterium]|jgi:lipooligosaccharide transport system permease protein